MEKGEEKKNAILTQEKKKVSGPSQSKQKTIIVSREEEHRLEYLQEDQMV